MGGVHVGLDFQSDFSVKPVNGFVRLVSPPLDDFAIDQKLAVLKVLRAEQAVFEGKEDQHLLFLNEVVFRTSHVRPRQYIDLLQGEVAVNHIKRLEDGELAERATVVSPNCFLDPHSRYED